MKLFKEPEGPLLFDRKGLVALIIPLMFEQLLSITVGVADTMMVAVAGETAISGISLVNQISVLLVVMFSAMASGGTVVAAQYLGKKDLENANSAARHLIILCFGIATVLSIFALTTNRWLLGVIYGSVEQDVMDAAVVYFAFLAFSYPFMALYNAYASLFRAMGNTRIALIVSIVMNAVNIVGNAILIYIFKLGVAGAAIATLVSRIVASAVVMILMRQEKWPINTRGFFRYPFRKFMVGQVLKIGVPQGLENSMFQLGKLLTSSLISGFGTASIAANATCSNIEQLCYMPASAMGLGLVTIIGQCVGANRYDQAKYYSKKMMFYTYLFSWGMNAIIFAFARPIIGLYNLSPEGAAKSLIIMRYYCCCYVFFWPLSFTLPNILRAAGDARFTLINSSIAMWCCRVVLAYVLGPYMQTKYNMGVWGVWIAMTLDWVVRGTCNVIRLASGKWMTKSLVADKKAA